MLCISWYKKKDSKEELRGRAFHTSTKPVSEVLGDQIIDSLSMDGRYKPIKEEEIPLLTSEVAVLENLRKLDLKETEKLEIGKDGLLVVADKKRLLYLPKELEEKGWNFREAVEKCCERFECKLEDCRMFSFEATTSRLSFDMWWKHVNMAHKGDKVSKETKQTRAQYLKPFTKKMKKNLAIDKASSNRFGIWVSLAILAFFLLMRNLNVLFFSF